MKEVKKETKSTMIQGEALQAPGRGSWGEPCGRQWGNLSWVTTFELVAFTQMVILENGTFGVCCLVILFSAVGSEVVNLLLRLTFKLQKSDTWW